MSPHTKAAMNKQQGEHSPFNKYRRQLDAQDQEANARLAEMETKLKEMQEKLMVVTFTFSSSSLPLHVLVNNQALLCIDINSY